MTKKKNYVFLLILLLLLGLFSTFSLAVLLLLKVTWYIDLHTCVCVSVCISMYI